MFQSPPAPEPMIKTLVPVISAFIGGLIGIMGSYMAFLYQRRSERKNITAAFAAEIYGLLEIAKRRNYIGVFKQEIENVKSGAEVGITIPVSQTYFNVYLKNVDKIGLLKPPTSSKIVEFYTTAFSLLEDLKSLEDSGVWQDQEQIIRHFQGLIETLQHLQKLGPDILKQINKKWKKQALNALEIK